MLIRTAQALAGLLLPRVCCVCDERVPDEIGEPLCARCAEGIRPLAEPMCPRCGAENELPRADGRCARCPVGKHHFDRIVAACVYEGPAGELVRRLKYHYREEYAPPMARRMLAALESLKSAGAPLRLVPVPLHHGRRRERGFNQAEEIAAELVRLTGATIWPRALVRIRATPSQARLTRRQRANNLRGAFRAGPLLPTPGPVILVDDVATSGATFNECASALAGTALAPICGLAFARATPRGHLH